MQQTKSSMFHKLFVALLSAAAIFTGIAWLANFRFPLAILQTIGIVDYGSVGGVDWHWSWTLRNDYQRNSRVTLYVSRQLLRIDHSNRYSAMQVLSKEHDSRYGPVVYRVQAYDRTPARPFIDHLQDGATVARLSARYVYVDIALLFLWPMFAAYPIWPLIRGPLTLRHRRKHGLCLNCGYSLAQLTEPRCPECGCEIESVSSA